MSTNEQLSTADLPTAARGAAAAVSPPKFWASSPAAWFSTADALFELRGVWDNVEKFYMVLCALSEANINRPAALWRPYRLQAPQGGPGFNAHLVRVPDGDHIVNMEPLNGRKPTELLAAMSMYRPVDAKHFFA
jgi:hypothetical protein